MSGCLSGRTAAKSLRSSSPLEASVTDNPNQCPHVPVLALPGCQHPPRQAWPVSMVTVGPAGCAGLATCQPRLSRVRNRSAAPPLAAHNGSVQGTQAHQRNYTVVIT